ncbi:MAG TPA: hypothetical protein VEF76_10195 [Patescibacteria group bacterium]|nr:hypothetical protein [Patescibacteria group bacterium]
MKTGLAVLLAVLLLPLAARADVSRIVADPSSKEILYAGGSQGLTTTWKITRVPTGGPVELTSPEGKLLVNGGVLATVPARTRRYSGNPDTLEFSEAITIPQAVFAAAKNGGIITFERQFSDNRRSFATGRQTVRVKMQENAAPVAPPAAAPAATAPPPARQALVPESPAPGAVINEQSLFRWPPVIGAAAYQVQILGPDNKQAYLSPTPANQVFCRDFVRKFADPALAYRWRVAAHDPTGNIIAISDWRALTVAKR